MKSAKRPEIRALVGTETLMIEGVQPGRFAVIICAEEEEVARSLDEAIRDLLVSYGCDTAAEARHEFRGSFLIDSIFRWTSKHLSLEGRIRLELNGKGPKAPEKKALAFEKVVHILLKYPKTWVLIGSFLLTSLGLTPAPNARNPAKAPIIIEMPIDILEVIHDLRDHRALMRWTPSVGQNFVRS
jgi:hypothetical protein